jgi:hypothetical protein
MERIRKPGFGLAILVASALVAAYAIGVTTQGWAFASPPAQSSTDSNTQGVSASPNLIVQVAQDGTRIYRPSAQQAETPDDTTKQEIAAREEALLNIFMSNFTSRLGVDEARLNSAFTEAVNATADQAVRDGILTQEVADASKDIARKDGFRTIVGLGFASGVGKVDGIPGDEYANPKAALIEAMNRIGVTTDELQRGFEAGKSLAAMAAEHNVDAATLKNMILQAYRSKLDAAVGEGKLTQEQADAQYDKFAPEVDTIINATNRSVNK